MVVILTVLVAGIWELLKYLTHAPHATMPHIHEIVGHFASTTSQGTSFSRFLLENASATFKEAFVGLVAGAIIGFMTGVIIATSKLVGSGLLPIVVAAQTIPIVAIAPALVLWLGPGWTTKMWIATYLTYFPVTVATARGIQAVPGENLDLMHICGASRLRTLFSVQVPSAAPYIFAGLETAAAFSVLGAIVGELPVGSESGLGLVLVTTWQYYNFQPEALYGATIATCVLGGLMVGLVKLAGRLVMGGRYERTAL
jgi:NitT/TauT family transport system permease protein